MAALSITPGLSELLQNAVDSRSDLNLNLTEEDVSMLVADLQSKVISLKSIQLLRSKRQLQMPLLELLKGAQLVFPKFKKQAKEVLSFSY